MKTPFLIFSLALLLASCSPKRQTVSTPTIYDPTLTNDCVYCRSHEWKNIVLVKQAGQFRSKGYYGADSTIVNTIDFAKYDLLIVDDSDIPLEFKLKYPPTSTGMERTMIFYSVECRRQKTDSLSIELHEAHWFRWAEIPKSALDSVSCRCVSLPTSLPIQIGH